MDRTVPLDFFCDFGESIALTLLLKVTISSLAEHSGWPDTVQTLGPMARTVRAIIDILNLYGGGFS